MLNTLKTIIKYIFNGLLQGGTDATGGTSYIGIPGSNTDLYSGTILSAQAGSAEMTDGVLPGILFIFMLFSNQ